MLAYLGIQQRNGAPNHPQTQGKIEHFHRTLKRWLRQQPAARTLVEAYRATPKAHPGGRGAPCHLRQRYDVTDQKGAMTLRWAGRMHHLKIGAAYARRRVLTIVERHVRSVAASRLMG